MLHFLLRHNQYSIINAFKLYCFISHQDGTAVMSWSLLSLIYCWYITTTVLLLLLLCCSGLFIIQTYPIQCHEQWCFIAVLHLLNHYSVINASVFTVVLQLLLRQSLLYYCNALFILNTYLWQCMSTDLMLQCFISH